VTHPVDQPPPIAAIGAFIRDTPQQNCKKSPMIPTREIMAYGIIALVLMMAVPWLAAALRRRKLRRLRQRGIKRYGH
jgi:hypothetical protein